MIYNLICSICLPDSEIGGCCLVFCSLSFTEASKLDTATISTIGKVNIIFCCGIHNKGTFLAVTVSKTMI